MTSSNHLRPHSPTPIKNGRWMWHPHHAGGRSGQGKLDQHCRCRQSLASAESYPSLETTNPALPDYRLTLRRAFLTYGLPETLTLDHGTVFYENTTPSPFPTRLHVWLLALGVQVRFTRKRCPTDHAIIEPTFQTMTAQALLGQTYSSPSALWSGLDERRQVLNHHLPSRMLSHQAP